MSRIQQWILAGVLIVLGDLLDKGKLGRRKAGRVDVPRRDREDRVTRRRGS